MYRLDYRKIKANEEIGLSNGYAELHDSFFIIRLDEDENNIIGIVKNKLNWCHFNLDGIFLDDDSITEREENGLFDYGDTIIYNKETKKINLYTYYPNDSDIEFDTDEETDSEDEDGPP